MMSNVKKKDVPLISISLGGHSFHRSYIKPFPHNNRPTRPTLYTLFCYAYVRFRRTGIGFAGNGTGDLFSHQ